MTPTPSAALALARALYECARVEPAPPPAVSWRDTTERLREKYRAVARAALARYDAEQAQQDSGSSGIPDRDQDGGMRPDAQRRAAIVWAELERGVHSSQAIGDALIATYRDGAQAERSRVVALAKNDDTAEELCVALKEAVGNSPHYRLIVKWTARALAEMIEKSPMPADGVRAADTGNG